MPHTAALAETATQIYARNRRRDPLARLLAIATRHAGRGLFMSARAAISEGCYLLERGESPYHVRRCFLRAVEFGAGAHHPDVTAARQLVRALDDADTAALRLAA